MTSNVPVHKLMWRWLQNYYRRKRKQPDGVKIPAKTGICPETIIRQIIINSAGPWPRPVIIAW
jgi:hypothetical protein